MWSQNKLICHLHDSKDFANIVNILSAALCLVAVILELIILFFVKELQLYGIDSSSQWIPAVEMQPISSMPTYGKLFFLLSNVDEER